MSTVTNTARPQRAPKPKRSRTRPLVITLVVLLALLVGADFGGAAIAEYQVSKRAKAAFNLADDPSVTINGFPFLTQAIGGDYGHITVDAKGVPIKDILKDVEIHADLRDVSAPLSDLLAGKTDSIVVKEMEAQVRVKEADFNRALKANNQRIQTGDITNVTIAPASMTRVNSTSSTEDFTDAENKAEQEELKAEAKNESTSTGVRLGATVSIADQKIDLAVYAVVNLVKGKIEISAKRVVLGGSIGSTALAPAIQTQLKQKFSPTLDPGTLPVAITPTAVLVEPGSISLKGKAQNVKLNSVSG
jgi:hypothetical protein